MKTLSSILGIALVAVLFNSCKQVEIRNSRCEMLINPLGIEIIEPRLSWEIISREKGVFQTGYHILVASSIEKLNNDEGDLWNSGLVESNQSTYVGYAGAQLSNRNECYWKVKVNTNKGESSWSKPSFWTVGLLDNRDWSADWIGVDRLFDGEMLDTTYTRLAARYLRKEFTVDKKVKKATLYISGLGLYEAYINDNKVGTQVLSPTPTDYKKRVKYNTFDVTNLMKQGENAIGVILGNGRYFTMRYQNSTIPAIEHFGFPKMLSQLEIEYNNGEIEHIVSDDSWKLTSNGPIRANNEFDGEEYDARMEMPGWTAAGFDDTNWIGVEKVSPPEGILEAQLNPNIQIMETLKPVSLSEYAPGTYILDMGQNMVGWLSLKVKGKEGDRVALRFAEHLDNNGSLYMDNIRGAKVTDTYTLKGTGEECWEPSFTYHGFRYVEIKGYPGIPTISDFEGKIIYDKMSVSGTIETSDSTLNQIYKNAYWGIRGNYRGMPTDCPQRDERMGWLGDRAVGSHGESFIFDNNSLYAKWLDDIEDAQLENGSIPDVAPAYWKFYSDNMTWPGAYVIVANMLYEQYGNIEPIRKHYASMKKWLTYMTDKYMVDNIMPKDNYGDWCMPPESPELIHSESPDRKTDGAVLGTTFYYRMMTLMQRFAEVINIPEDVIYFEQKAHAVKNAFNNKYLDKDNAQYSNNTVTANLLPLSYGMVPDDYTDRVFNNIVNKTETDFKSHVSTGLIGIQWLMRGLSDHGRADLAYKIAQNRDYPSWGYMVENEATTIWELWNGNTANPAMNSGNHVMLLGDLIIWYYEYLAGIKNAPGSIGFERIEMKPYPVKGLNYVKANFHSVKGEIRSSWIKNNDEFIWDITIPCNTVAKVYIPAKDQSTITINNVAALSYKEAKFEALDNDRCIFNISSGDYRIKVSKK